MTEGTRVRGSIRVAVSGIPRGYHYPRPDGNWLQEDHRECILAISSDIELVEMPAHKVDDVAGVEILLAEGGNRLHYPGELDREDYQRFFTPSLNWVQLCSTGFSDNVTPQVLDGRVTLTNAPGLHTIPLAESVVAAMLDHAKRFRQRRIDQKTHAWNRLRNDELYGRTVLIVGLGRIGTRVAQICQALGMRVLGTKWSVAPVANVDLVFPIAQLARHVGEADYVVLALPHTSETENLVGKGEFQAMKSAAYLINVGRGRVIDEPAMVQALADRRIAGAYLDTFAEEPLPEEHVLWDMENVFLVPHDSHSSPFIGDRLVDLFCDNLRRYVAGEPLQNICDPQRGY